MTLDRFKSTDERGVSPVIGVILMVAITVILAAVIASFVLGLGGNNEPAPQPTVESEFSQQTLNFSVTGGDEFDPSVATVGTEVTLNGSKTASLSDQQINSDAADFETFDSGAVGVSYNQAISGDSVSAGDEFSFGVNNTAYEIESWEVEVIWNPADQDSSVIIDRSSN